MTSLLASECGLDRFSQLLEFLRQLENAKIAYELRHSRDEAIMVKINVPGERWEVEFLEDDEIEVERFRSNGHIDDASTLQELFAQHSDAGPEATQTVNTNDAIARK
jgi:hypothetical protein